MLKKALGPTQKLWCHFSGAVSVGSFLHRQWPKLWRFTLLSLSFHDCPAISNFAKPQPTSSIPLRTIPWQEKPTNATMLFKPTASALSVFVI
jgi:hypothetical protein